MSKGTNGAYAAAEPPPAPEPPPTASPELKARIDRYGEILAKAFDLAEAGVSLGLTVIGAVGAAAQKKILESRADGGGEPSVGPPPGPRSTESPAEPEDGETDEPPDEEMPRIEMAFVPVLSMVTPGVKRATSWKSLMRFTSKDSWEIGRAHV